MPTAVLIGAGPGLGSALAHRLAREGYDLAVISRNPQRHVDRLRDGLPGAARVEGFAADVTQPTTLVAALDRVVEIFGDVDVVYYGPSLHDVTAEQKTITQIDGADVAAAMGGVYPAMDVVSKVLPSMLERRKGALLFASAISAVMPIPELGAMTVPASVARGYALTLNAALAPQGVYAGVLVIGGLIAGSGIHEAMAADPERFGPVDSSLLLDPERVADIAMDLIAKRSAPEAVVTPGAKGVGLTMLLIGRLIRVPMRNGRARRRSGAGRAVAER